MYRGTYGRCIEEKKCALCVCAWDGKLGEKNTRRGAVSCETGWACVGVQSRGGHSELGTPLTRRDTRRSRDLGFRTLPEGGTRLRRTRALSQVADRRHLHVHLHVPRKFAGFVLPSALAARCRAFLRSYALHDPRRRLRISTPLHTHDSPQHSILLQPSVHSALSPTSGCPGPRCLSACLAAPC